MAFPLDAPRRAVTGPIAQTARSRRMTHLNGQAEIDRNTLRDFGAFLTDDTHANQKAHPWLAESMSNYP